MKEEHDDLERELGAFLKSYDPYVRRYFKGKISGARGYSPLAADFYKKLAEFSQGGKKMRAFLVWLGYQVGGGLDLAKILPISLAFEMTQNFLLIHDDVVDNSPLRRGKPTIHKIYGKKFGTHYGESMAVILGDIASVEVFNIVADCDFPSDFKILCQKLFAKTLLETAFGQGLDVEYSFKKPTFAQIMEIADLKSARYSVRAPLLIGANLAGAKAQKLKALARYGTAVGLAYQIADDILGVFGNPQVLGKSVLSDMREGKNTLLIHKTKQLTGEGDRKIIDRIWGNSGATNADFGRVKRIIEESGALAWCVFENQRLAAKAKTEIKRITANRALQIILAQVADFVISRQK